MLNSRRDFPGRVLTVHYESFLEDALAELERLWRALELPPVEQEQHRRLLEQDGASHLVTEATRHLHANVTRAPMRDRATGWRSELGAFDAAVIRLVCGRHMRRLGYLDQTGAGPGPE